MERGSHLIGEDQLLSVLAFVLALEAFEYFAVHKESSDVFAMKFGWRIFYFVLLGVLLVSIWQYPWGAHRPAHAAPLWLLLALAIVLVLTRPNTVVTNSSGLASYGLWGLRRRFIAWTDVGRIASDWEEEHFKVWTFTGYTVSVIGLDGTRIDHTIFLRGQGRFLDDLRQRVRAERFAPGLADWHP